MAFEDYYKGINRIIYKEALVIDLPQMVYVKDPVATGGVTDLIFIALKSLCDENKKLRERLDEIERPFI